MDKKHITELDAAFWALTDEDRDALRVGRVILQQYKMRKEIINRIEWIVDWIFNLND